MIARSASTPNHPRPSHLGRRLQPILLACGILSPLLYAVADGLAGSGWEGYSFRDRAISELGAIGAPSRPLFSLLLLVVYLLLLAFGIGVRRSTAGRRAVRVVGGLLIALAVMALSVGQFVPMRLRGTEQGSSGRCTSSSQAPPRS